MRVASLLPAATEWVAAFGAADRLVARSHECDHPSALDDVPVVTKATYAEDRGGDASSQSRAVDRAVREQLDAGLSLYDVDTERLRALRPDLVLTQAQCEVCAVSLGQLEHALADQSSATGEGEDGRDAAPRLLSLSPDTLKDAFDTGLTVGRALGRIEAAMSFLAAREKRLRALRETLPIRDERDSEQSAGAARPTVACVEWIDPFMTAGHWTPDLVEQAGGRAVLSEAGGRSRRADWNALRDADPDVLAVMPCGFDLEETAAELHGLTERPGWSELSAVRNGRVWLFDGNAYFNRPGPRLYRSAELMAAALHPEHAQTFVEPESGEMHRLV
jgi:iron complex transport system substrate-binding protein